MGWVMMSERMLGRIEVPPRVLDGSMSAITTAPVLAVSTRHIRRMIKWFREDDAAALRHGLRGRPSNNQIQIGLREDVTRLVCDRYADFGPTLAAEKRLGRHGLKAPRKTLRTWIAADGLWLSRKQCRTFHQPRLRRERLGELIQPLGTLLRIALPYCAFDDNQQRVTHAGISEKQAAERGSGRCQGTARCVFRMIAGSDFRG